MPRTKKVAAQHEERKSSNTKLTQKSTVTEKTIEKDQSVVKAKQQIPLTMDVLDLKGNIVGSLSLPEEIFAAKVNKTLMAQAVRVYLANQRLGTLSTKSRGEVVGSTRKIYRQKGTGRARHGGIRAPIFVGGGVAHGPKPRDFSLSLPQKMKRAALFSALTLQRLEGNMKVIAGLESLEPKTKAFAQVLKNLSLAKKKKKILLVLPEKIENIQKAARNIEGVTYVLANQLNTYDVLNAGTLLFMKDTISKIQEIFKKE
ncbi:MAG: 50S ribosomal protein L4 [Patescibacteria group bacterium]|nr:MAG: 50S ribosomal protein L4 [Patescibacteria group bacterium]